MTTAPERLLVQIQRTPAAPALVMGSDTWSYAKLGAEATALAQRLRALGVGRGMTVAVLLERSPEMVASLFAVQLAGAAFIPLDSETPPERLTLILGDAKPAALVTSRRLAVRVQQPPVALLLVDAEHAPPTDPLPALPLPQADDVAYLIYTSGSTGRPKGAINFHRGVANLYDWFAAAHGMGPHTRSLIISSIGFDQTHKAVWAPLTVGGTVVLLETPYYDPVLIRETCARTAATFISCTPSALYGLIENAGDPGFAALGSLTHVFPIGEALRYERLREWVGNPHCRAQVVNTYGPTECADVLTAYPVTDFSQDGVVPLGTPLPGISLLLLGADGEIAPPGDRGELCAYGICVGGGYLNLPEQTAKAFIDHPAVPGGGKLYRTGDLASVGPDGIYRYHGRLDHQVKIRGHRIELQEVESVLGRHPAVAEAACTAPEDPSGNAFLAAYMRLRPGETADIAGLRQHLRRSLPDYMTPSTFSFLEAMPLNPSGKLDRRALPPPVRGRPPVSSTYTPPEGPLETALEALWAEVLGYGGIGTQDRFFELGGSSIQAIQVVGRLSRLLDLRVPIAQFFSAPTIRGLAGWLANAHPEAASRWLGGADVRPTATRNVAKASTAGGSGGDIAIVGMAARVPGATDLDSFWQLLIEGREGLHRLSDAELDAAGIPEERRRQPNYVRAGGYLEGADSFDAAFFGIPAREAQLMDPQHRVFLELAWTALEHAGIDVQRERRPIGVFAGVARNAYLTHNIASHADLRESAGDYYTMLGNDKDYVATRTAFKLDLKGPAFTVQTACSSSGVALHLAMQSLRAGECDAALVGGGRIISPMQGGYTHIEGGPLSADGQVRAFDAGASGMVRSSGMACIVVKRLVDALADGDTIYSIVKGSAVNNDGGEKAAYTAPSVEGQAAVIAQALAAAQVPAASVRYVEAHGTATLLGDPIEFAGLNRVYGAAVATPGHIGIGSVKSNIGHLDAGAAMAGVIKTSLALSRGLIPPSLHFERANPEIPFAQSPFAVVTAPTPWPAGATLRAAVSSFGIGGTNVHLVLEEAPKALDTTPAPRPNLLRLSARQDESLQAAAANLAAWSERHPEVNLADAAYTLDRGRARFERRAIAVAHETADAATALRQKLVTGATLAGRPRLAFTFPGQGAQHPGMGETLYRREPVFREALDRCATLLEQPLGIDLRALLYPAPEGREASAAQLRNTQLAQPAIFAVSYATASWWLHLGLEPEAMIGHSVGELVAATLAGVFDLPDALTLLVERARLMQSMPGGGMMAVRLPEAELLPRLGGGVDLAGVNAPQLSVVAGPHEALAAFRTRLEAEGIGCSVLHTSHAFHSAMMEPAVAPFTAAIGRLPRHAPQRRLVSTVTGRWAESAELQDPAYWASQLRQPVRFAPAVATLLQEPGWVLLECGPGQNLTTSARQQLAGHSVAVASLPHAAAEGADAQAHLVEAMGRLWIAGIEIAPERLYAGELRRSVGLPGYAFARTRHWIEPAAAVAAETSNVVETAKPAVTTPGAAPVEEGDAVMRNLLAVLADCTGSPIPAAQHDENWLSLGMDSLLLTQVAGKLKARFKVEVKFRALLETHTTVNKLAAHLRALAAAPLADAAPPPAWNDAPKTTQETALPAAAGSAPPKAFGAQAKISKSESGQLNARQQAALEAFSARYLARTGKSKETAQRHRATLADPRTVSGFRPLFKELIYPIVTDRSDGAYLWDLDGNRYIDITNGFGCIFFGHRPEFVVKALEAQLRKGFEIGPQTPLAGECAEAFSRFTGLPRVAFCNTGSEAVLAAMRMARTVSGKSLILMHTNDYHGIQDEVIVRPAADGRALPAAPGIPRESTANIVIKDYGDPATLRFVEERADDLAAVLVEPVQSRNADLQPAEYLKKLRALTERTGAAFIMDEVITGFRAHLGGAQAYFGVKADLATYGKVIGGGMPIGVVAGIEKYMDTLDGGFWQYGDASVPEVGVTYFAGTFVRHPLTMAAVKGVCEFFEKNPDPHTALNRRTQAMVEEINAFFKRVGAPVHIANFTSLLRAQFTHEQPYGELFFLLLREAGLHIFEGRPCFLTLAHTDADVEAIVRAFRWATEQMFAGDFFVHAARPAEQALAIAKADPYASPAPGARLGRHADGRPGWFLPDPARAGGWQAVRPGTAPGDQT